MAATTVTRQQYFQAVGQLGDMTALYAAIDANPGSAIWIEFYSAIYVIRGDVLSNLTQSVFGWSDAQMDTLFNTAASLPGSTLSNTLGSMRARIADELSRSDLTSQISLAINDAIAHYQRKRFYFNETGPDGSTFNTVANQETYTSSDDPDIPYMYDVDDVFVTVGVNNFRVKRIDPTIYRINQMPSFKGQPYQYMFLNQTFSFSPIPNAAYQMQIVGHYKLAGPQTDSEMNNKWMNDAERLIRNSAKRILCQEVIMDADSTAAYMAAENEALDSLSAATDSMIRTGYIQPVAF